MLIYEQDTCADEYYRLDDGEKESGQDERQKDPRAKADGAYTDELSFFYLAHGAHLTFLFFHYIICDSLCFCECIAPAFWGAFVHIIFQTDMRK